MDKIGRRLLISLCVVGVTLLYGAPENRVDPLIASDAGPGLFAQDTGTATQNAGTGTKKAKNKKKDDKSKDDKKKDDKKKDDKKKDDKKESSY
jgi:hypothetical protein